MKKDLKDRLRKFFHEDPFKNIEVYFNGEVFKVGVDYVESYKEETLQYKQAQRRYTILSNIIDSYIKGDISKGLMLSFLHHYKVPKLLIAEIISNAEKELEKSIRGF